MKQILDAISSTDTRPEDYAALEIPASYRGVVVRKDETKMFAGLAARDKDPRQSLHVDEVPVPELAPGEALVAVMASAINYNTVWTSIFEPVSTFGFLERYGRLSPISARHDQPYHVVGSDLAGVVLRTGPGVHVWQPGAEVVAHCLSVELEHPDGHNDTVLDPEQRIWGFETNFGGLAELAVVKANQLMPKPGHLTWEEAATPGLVNSTAYRQLVSRNGAGMKQGDTVLIWGASGGLGGYATQLAVNGGAMPVCVVSSTDKAELCRSMGAELIIDRRAEDYRFWSDEHTQDPSEWRRLGARIRELTGGEDPDIVLEHPGRETFGASTYVARRGGTIVTCASTSGFLHEYDNRYLWMNLKRIIGSHFANYREAWEPTGSWPRASSIRRCPSCTHWRTPGRLPGRFTRTSTRARSECCAWPRRRVSACATRNYGRATPTPSTDSAVPDLARVPSDPAPATAGVSRGTVRSTSHMADQGLSIFESAAERADQEATQQFRVPVAPQQAPQATPQQAPQQAPQAAPRQAPQAPPPPTPAPASNGPAAPPARPVAGRGGDAPAVPDFPVSRRGGYDRRTVDEWVDDRLRNDDAAAAAVASLRSQVSSLETRLRSLQRQVSENETPSYAGLGSRAAELLALAEQQADDVMGRATQQADDLRRMSEKDAARARADAAAETEDTRSVQLRELDEARQRIQHEIREQRTAADVEVRDLVASATRSADQHRLAAEQESNSVRTSAKREAEQVRAAADREVSEARRVLAVERERLSKEALGHHTTAMEETRRLVLEAEERASAAETRARAAIDQATKNREDASVEAERTLTRARREAEQLVTSAKRQAEQLLAQANADLERQSAQARTELDHVQRRRDGIVAQLAQLRDIVSSFAGPDLPPNAGEEQPQQEQPQQEQPQPGAQQQG